MTEADERRLKERYEGGMGGLSEEAYACAPDVLWLIEQVKKYQNLHAKMTVYAEQVEHQQRKASRLMTAAAIERDALREALVHIAGADDQTIEEADSGAYLRDMARKAIKKEGR